MVQFRWPSSFKHSEPGHSAHSCPIVHGDRVHIKSELVPGGIGTMSNCLTHGSPRAKGCTIRRYEHAHVHCQARCVSDYSMLWGE